MEFQESWLLRFNSFQRSSSWKRRATWEERKKEGGGTKISSKFLQLLLSWAGLFSQSLHPEPCYHGNLLAAYKAVTAYSGVSAAEPENVTEEVQFPGLLTWKIYIQSSGVICEFTSKCCFSHLELNIDSVHLLNICLTSAMCCFWGFWSAYDRVLGIYESMSAVGFWWNNPGQRNKALCPKISPQWICAVLGEHKRGCSWLS